MSETMVAEAEVADVQDEDIPILFLHGIERHYRQGDATLHILNGLDLAIWAGQSPPVAARHRRVPPADD